MQKAYISALYKLAQRDRNVVSLLTDSGTDYDELFARDFPDQCFNFGIGEENVVAAAAGMAACGKIPFVYTTGAFMAYRAMEFVRNDVCFQNMNVKIVGMGSGLAWSTLGPSHHATEDISVLRALPNLTILCPATPREAAGCVEAAYGTPGPVYIRMGMSNEREIHPEDWKFVPGKNEVVRKGGDLTVFVTGSILSEVLDAAELLSAEGLEAAVVNVHTLKPVDRQSIVDAAQTGKPVFTVEEHNVEGGLGSIVADILAESGAGIRFRKIGIRDRFATGYGTIAEVRHMNAVDAEGIHTSIREALS
jgi:transketolase